MATCYVVLAHTDRPNVLNVPYPVAVFDARKDAARYAERKNETSRRLNYYVRPATKEPQP